METQKFKTDVEILKNFFPVYCHDKHNNQIKKHYAVNYNLDVSRFQISLCKECHKLISYSLQRLQECPHYEKPKCRKCPKPCYDKQEWKALAKLMKYSGIKLGYIKIKNKLTYLLK